MEPSEVWQRARDDRVEILDLRTGLERRRYGAPPGARPVSLIRHMLWPRAEGAVYLCQHAKRSKLTRWRGAAEVAGGFSKWSSSGLPVDGP